MTKVSALGQDSSPTTDDILYVVDLAGPTSKKVTLADLATLFFTPANIPTDYRQGWINVTGTWSYSSWDSTNKTGVITVPSGAASIYTIGMKIRISQATGGTKYGIITKIADTALTVFFGQDYTLNNEAISSPNYSLMSAPFGFPKDPTKWSVSLSDTSGTLSNPGGLSTIINWQSLSISIPIGSWNVYVDGVLVENTTSSGAWDVIGGISTANNSISDGGLVGRHKQPVAGTGAVRSSFARTKQIVVTSATTYYVIIEAISGSGTVTIGFDGTAAFVIKVVNAYY